MSKSVKITLSGQSSFGPIKQLLAVIDHHQGAQKDKQIDKHLDSAFDDFVHKTTTKAIKIKSFFFKFLNSSTSTVQRINCALSSKVCEFDEQYWSKSEPFIGYLTFWYRDELWKVMFSFAKFNYQGIRSYL